jgi:tRNA A-37 threonylcarbamoyl transferase component Bud32
MPQNDVPAHEDRINEAIAEYLDAVDRGQTPGQDQFLAQHAEIRDELTSFLANQALVRNIAGQIPPSSPRERAHQPNKDFGEQAAVQTNDDQEFQLVALLDEAVDELRLGREINPADWSRQHPELGDRGEGLIGTLRNLTLAAKDWRDAASTIVQPDQTLHPAELRRTSAQDATLISSADDSAPQPSTACARPPLPERFGRYEVLDWIGNGAMGDVYRALDPQLDRAVAVKVPKLDRRDSHSREFAERFLREARTAAAVRHPHVCPIHDVGEHQGTPYVVMAFVEGESLAQRLKRVGRYENPREAVALVLDVAEALQEVHQHGIIHRDLKPGNILLDQAGQAILTDFGLARSFLVDERLTADGGLVGTPAYMSPEQALGEGANLGPASDLYSLGIVLYELLSGTLPYTGGAASMIVNKATRAAPSPLDSVRSDLDPQLVAIVEWAIRHDPSERFPSAAGLAAALRNWLATQGAPARGAPVASVSPPASAARAPSRPTRRGWNKSPSRLVAVAACLAVIPGVWWTVWGRDPAGGSDPRVAAPHHGATSQSDHAGEIDPSASISDRPLLAGKLAIRFIDASPSRAAGNAGARRAKAGDARPLFNGQSVQLQVSLSHPGYAYLIWIDSDGTADPIYPWDFGHSKELWAAPRVPGSEEPASFIPAPRERGSGFVAGGKPGMQHVVLLARTTPLKNAEQLQAALSGLPPSPLGNGSQVAEYFDLSPRTVCRRGLVRGLIAGELGYADEADEDDQSSAFDKTEIPLLAQLKERLRPHEFELIKVWRFAQTED